MVATEAQREPRGCRSDEEVARPTFRRERAALKRGVWPVAGCDEAGRGPLAGPVVAAAVILDPDDVPRGLDDSKRLTPERREVLYERICARAQVAVAMAPPWRIDRDNILRASLWALARAVAALPVKPRLVFVDGRDRIAAGCDCQAVIGGDGLVASVAAASIVAKVTRDRLMACLGAAHPGYGFERHMGYSVPEHFAALDRLGPTIHHRRSFAPVAGASACWAPIRRSRRRRAAALRLSPMFYVPLYFEAIRTRPTIIFWMATLAQAVLWIPVPMLFYSAPPGDVAQVLAVGHEFQFDSDVGPPLAFWFAEVAYRIGGLFGVYALSQLCVIVTYWCVFALGSAIVGPAQAVWRCCSWSGFRLHGADAGFRPGDSRPWRCGPSCSALLARGHARERQSSWYVFGAAAALLLMTSEGALILLGRLRCSRRADRSRTGGAQPAGPWIVMVVLIGFLFLHLLWLEGLPTA